MQQQCQQKEIKKSTKMHSYKNVEVAHHVTNVDYAPHETPPVTSVVNVYITRNVCIATNCTFQIKRSYVLSTRQVLHFSRIRSVRSHRWK